ncbi:MAG TPA: DMT family transporter [Gammaproteobacteria bacterium]
MHSDSASKHSATVLPVISLLITATLWGVAWYPLRIAESYGIAGLWTSLLIYGAALLCGSLAFWRKFGEIQQQPLMLGAIALTNGWLNIAFILAVIEGNVVRVVLLFYLSPLWSTLLGWLVLKEQLTAWSMATLVVAMIGAMIMLWDPSLGFPWPQNYADWLAITSGMAFSVSNVLVRKLQQISVRTKTMSAWMGVTLVAAIWILLGDVPTPHVEARIWIWTTLIGCSMIMVMTLAVQYGVTHMPVYRSAVILLFELVAAALSAQWLSDEVIEGKELIGGGLIIVAGYLSARALMKQGAVKYFSTIGQ